MTLTGFVRSYLQKCEAERAAKRVSGVLGLANDIEVRLPSESQRTDPELAREAVAAIKTELPYAHENVKVLVKTGWATLEGSVEWDYQRTRAERAVRALKGIKGISNLITLKPRVAPAEITSKIEDAFKRPTICWRDEDRRISCGFGGLAYTGVLSGHDGSPSSPAYCDFARPISVGARELEPKQPVPERCGGLLPIYAERKDKAAGKGTRNALLAMNNGAFGDRVGGSFATKGYCVLMDCDVEVIGSDARNLRSDHGAVGAGPNVDRGKFRRCGGLAGCSSRDSHLVA